MPDRFIRPYLFMACSMFLISSLAGYLTPHQYQQEIVKTLLANFSPMQSSTRLQFFIKIFLNNYLSTLLTLLLGLLFCFGPVLFLLINGFTMGNLVAFASSKVGIYKIGFAIVPHGIFEVPAVLIASSYGLWWGVKNYRRVRCQDYFGGDFSLPLNRYINVVIPLLLIAAFVEAYITPFIIRHLI